MCLPPKLAQILGSISPICICTHVTQTVHLIDPNTLQGQLFIACFNDSNTSNCPSVFVKLVDQIVIYTLFLKIYYFFSSVADVSGTQFWRYPFVNLCSPKRFVEFMVMQVDIIPEKDRPHRVPVSNKVLYPRDRSCPPPPQPSPSHRALIMTNKSLL